jgi:photosystem II stability/assembly factor-like uncharacterized protein
MNAYPRGIAVLCLLLSGLFGSAFGQTEPRESEETVRARYEHWLNKRLDENGNFSMNAVLQAKLEVDARRTAGPLQRAMNPGGWNWEWLGPGNVGGRIENILINPFNRNVIWVASPGGGIWKTTNRGLTWSPVNDFLPILNVVSLTIDPLISTNMYAGTGEYEYMGGYGRPITAGRNITGVGILKSTDGGLSWFQLASTNNPDFNYVSRLDHYPAMTNRLVAGTATGLYRTSDGGSNWTRILLPDSLEPVRDVKINPANSNRILVGTTMDVYLTIDGGYTWVRQTTGIRGKMPVSPGRCELAIAPTNTNVMYVSCALRTGGNQLWQTTNGGTIWRLQSSNVTTVNAYTDAIWVSPTDPNFIAVGGTDFISRSTDGGANFVAVSDWRGYHNGRTTSGFSPHGDFHAIVSDPAYDGSTNKIVFVGNDGGIQRTSDITTVSPYNGWTNLANNLGVTQFYGGAASPDGSLIVGGTQDLYNVNYYANTVSWGPYGGVDGWWNYIYGDGGFAAIDYTNGAYVYAEAQWLGVDCSTDSGRTYTPARNGLHDSGNGNKALFVAPLVMDPNNPTVLLAGGTSIWRTTNRAASWDSIRAPVLGNPKCSAIDIYKANSNVIWIGYDNGLVSYTVNNGATWNDVGKPGGSRFVTDIAINPTPTAYAEVMVTVGGYSGNNVWLSSDNGSTWVPRTGQAPDNLPAIQINTVRYHPLQTNRVYVGTDLGVFASTDRGVHWNVAPQSLQNEGPANTPVEELFWQGTTYLIAATHGRGMFRVNPLIVSVPEDAGTPGTFALAQNYPNPFNPKTVVSFQTSVVSDVRLVVYDLLGREVAVLMNDRKMPGKYDIEFDASGLSSGVYFYRLTAGHFVECRKMVLMK